MSDLYLIAHRVRREPAFDIAIKLQIGDEEGWIIPTSGHRAYPYWFINMLELEGDIGQGYLAGISGEMPDDWPDHYPTRSSPKPEPIDLLKSLGLIKPIDINRRV